MINLSLVSVNMNYSRLPNRNTDRNTPKVVRSQGSVDYVELEQCVCAGNEVSDKFGKLTVLSSDGTSKTLTFPVYKAKSQLAETAVEAALSSWLSDHEAARNTPVDPSDPRVQARFVVESDPA